MRTEFFMPMLPPTKTHQEKRVRIGKDDKGKPIPIFYEDDELKAVRLKLIGHLGKHVPDKKYTGGVRFITKWLFAIPENSKHKNGDYKITKPDTDNMIKTMKDCMTKLGYWKDDSLVASEIIEKFWADKPGIYICIESLEVDK